MPMITPLLSCEPFKYILKYQFKISKKLNLVLYYTANLGDVGEKKSKKVESGG